MNNLYEDNDKFFEGIRYERKNVQPGSMADLFLAEVERWGNPPRSLRERRTRPPSLDTLTAEGDSSVIDGHTGSPDDSTG